MGDDAVFWGFVHQKKTIKQAEQEIERLLSQNMRLRKIVKNLLEQVELTKEDKEFLEKIQLGYTE